MYAERGGQGPCMFFKMLFKVHCNFEKGSQNQQMFSKYSFVREGGVTQKSTLSTLLIMFTILNDPT